MKKTNEAFEFLLEIHRKESLPFLELKEGEILGVRYPPSFSSADFLMDLILGLNPPAEGFVKFMGKDWEKIRPSEQTSLRSLIRRNYLKTPYLNNLTLQENLTLSIRHHGTSGDKELREELRILSERFRLEHQLLLRPYELSREQGQRGQMIRLLLCSPRLLLVDQPESFFVSESLFSSFIEIFKTLPSSPALVFFSSNPSGFFDNLTQKVMTLNEKDFLPEDL